MTLPSFPKWTSIQFYAAIVHCLMNWASERQPSFAYPDLAFPEKVFKGLFEPAVAV